MRTALVLALLVVACSPTSPSSVNDDARSSPNASPTSRPTPVPGCRPTETQDATGVITRDGKIGIAGETFAVGDLMNGSTAIVRRGATLGDRIAVKFDQIGRTAPATWVAYDVDATPHTTPWGGVVFRIGWKPIAFEDSCWQLIVDGADTGIVLAVGH